MARSSFLLSTCCLTLIFAVRIIFTNPSTCADLQSSRQQIWALADIGNKYMLITSKGMLFDDIHKRNLVKTGEKYKLNLTGMQALSFDEKFPDFPVEIKFGDHSKTKIFIADTDKGTVLGVLEKNINFITSDSVDWFAIPKTWESHWPTSTKVLKMKDWLYVFNIRDNELMHLLPSPYIEFFVSMKKKDSNSITQVYVYDKSNKAARSWLALDKNLTYSNIFCVNGFYHSDAKNLPTSALSINDKQEDVLLFNMNKNEFGLIEDIKHHQAPQTVTKSPMSEFIVCDERPDKDKGYGDRFLIIILIIVMLVIIVGLVVHHCWRTYQKKKKRVKGQPSWVRPYPHSRVATSEFSIFNWKSYFEEPKIREKHICKHSIVTQASSTSPPATTFTSTIASQVSLQNQNKKDGPTTEQALGTFGTPSKLPVSTDTSTVVAVTGRTSSKPSTAFKAGSKATNLKTSKFSFTTVQSIVSSLTNKIANALGHKSKVNIADIAPKTSTTCTPTTTLPILKISKLSKSKVSKAAPKVSKVSTALTASRASAASKKFKKKKHNKTLRASRATVVRTLTSIRKTSASSIATSKNVKKKSKKRTKRSKKRTKKKSKKRTKKKSKKRTMKKSKKRTKKKTKK